MRNILPDPVVRPKLDTSMFIVNIVLLLILFFLATGRLLNTPNSGVDLAETDKLPVESLPKPLLVVRDAGLELNGDPVTADALGAALAGETRLHVLIARDKPAMDLLDLLSRPELAGLELRLVTVRTPGPGPVP
jgi:hypothetical protein